MRARLILLVESGLLSAQNGTTLFSSRGRQPLRPSTDPKSTAATLQKVRLGALQDNHISKLHLEKNRFTYEEMTQRNPHYPPVLIVKTC